MKVLGRQASFLALAFVLAAALLGSAYTLWFEDVRVSVHASTTSLDGQIKCGALSDSEDEDEWPWPPPPSNVFPPHTEYPLADPVKDVAVGPISTNPGPPFHSWSLTVTNVYPGYAFDCEVEVRNSAPLPWHMEDIDVVVEECQLPSGPCAVLSPPPASQTTTCISNGQCTWGDIGINPPDYPDGLEDWSPVYVELENWEGCQIHQNDTLEGSLFVGVNQPAKENTRYVITLKYTVNQWNESIWTDCGDLKNPL